MLHHLHWLGALMALLATGGKSAKYADVPDMTLEQLRDFVRRSDWRFAKTMPKSPHEYTLRAKAPNDALFQHVVLYIRKAGYDHVFGKTTYRYLDIDGWCYWTMGNPVTPWPADEGVAVTRLINRTKLKCEGLRCRHVKKGKPLQTPHYNCPAHGPHVEFYCPICQEEQSEQRSLWPRRTS